MVGGVQLSEVVDVEAPTGTNRTVKPRFPEIAPAGQRHSLFRYRIDAERILINSSGTLSICVANDVEKRLHAWRLAARVYRQMGYIPSDAPELMYGPHDALSHTVTFLAQRRSRYCGTLTVVRDGSLMLPADEVFGPAIQRLRDEGRTLCEVVSLSSCEQGVSGVGLMKHFCKLAFLVAYGLNGATDMLITVNPRHRFFYERIMLYTPLSGPVPYGKVNGAPAMLLRLDLKKVFSSFCEKYRNLPASKNPLVFVLHRAQEMTQWIDHNRRPMDLESKRMYFS